MNSSNEDLIRVMALHALAYCERLFYLEEVEEIRIADAAVYAGRALHEELARVEEDKGEWANLELSSNRLGLVGKVDCLRRYDGSVIPYEHKRGRARQTKTSAAAWDTDALQVWAYAMLLEEESGATVPEGRIRYHKDNVTVRVPIDDAARRAVIDAVARARILRESGRRPPVASNDRLCIKCSLAPVCLPEEERLAADPEWEPIRLFPADREAKSLHVLVPGSTVSRAGQTLRVKVPDAESSTFPIHEIETVILHGYAQITSQAIHFCASNDVPVHLVSTGGRYVGAFVPGAGAVHRRLRQYEALQDEPMRLRLARKLLLAKVEGGLRYVLRATRGKDRANPDLSEAIERLRSALKSIAHAEDPNSLRGHEGLAGRAYFSCFKAMLRKEVPDELRFTARTRRPPRDRFNALLGFGYSLVYQAVLQAVTTVGLDPAIGFFHTPRSSAYPLVLDLMELMRCPLWDMTQIGSLNRLQWHPEEDFVVTPNHVWLSQSGRKKAIQLFERRLAEKWKHPVVQYSLSYSRLLELEVRLLEKEWSGQSGLFAEMRLR